MVAIMAYIWADSFLVDNLEWNCASSFLGCRMDPIRIVFSDNKIEPKIVTFFSRRSGAFASEDHVH